MKGKLPSQQQKIKMKVMNSLQKEETTQLAEEMIEKGTIIVSDKSNSYIGLNDNYSLDSQVVKKEDINKVLPWVHTAISNAKRMFLDVHHRIDDDFLQSYLNGFCFKFNRRYFDNLFDRLMVAAVSYRWNWFGEENG
jgi:hypothetical protein